MNKNIVVLANFQIALKNEDVWWKCEPHTQKQNSIFKWFFFTIKYGNKPLEKYTLNAQYDVISTSQYHTTTVYTKAIFQTKFKNCINIQLNTSFSIFILLFLYHLSTINKEEKMFALFASFLFCRHDKFTLQYLIL